MEETGKEKRYSRDPEANQIKKRDRRRKKGSLTVEASLVVPLCVMILTFLLSLTFYVYLRCWYTQAACEVSVQGSGYGVLEGRTGQEKAEKKWKTKRSESGFSGKGISGEITGNQKEVRVKITGKVSVWGRLASGVWDKDRTKNHTTGYICEKSDCSFRTKKKVFRDENVTEEICSTIIWWWRPGRRQKIISQE